LDYERKFPDRKNSFKLLKENWFGEVGRKSKRSRFLGGKEMIEMCCVFYPPEDVQEAPVGKEET
jgi:hypothetical protein